MTDSLSAPSLSRFVDHENTTFTVQSDDDTTVELRLTEVTTQADTGDWERFSLWFDTEGETNLAQNHYRLSHPQLDSFDVTISPILAGDPNGHAYEAVFDRSTQASESEDSSAPSAVGDLSARPTQAEPRTVSNGVRPYIGELLLFAGPQGIQRYGRCDGTLIPVTQNEALYSILGAKYGGNGTTNFALPDLRGRVPLHYGTPPGRRTYRFAEQGGLEEAPIRSDQLPPHTHDVGSLELPVSTGTGEKDSPDGNKLAEVKAEKFGDEHIYADNAAYGSMSLSGTTAATGEGDSISNMQPYLAMTYLISLQGTYPPRP